MKLESIFSKFQWDTLLDRYKPKLIHPASLGIDISQVNLGGQDETGCRKDRRKLPLIFAVASILGPRTFQLT
jgi:hypothetical protein